MASDPILTAEQVAEYEGHSHMWVPCPAVADLARSHEALRTERDALRIDLEELHSWDGLMSLLDDHYPADVFVGNSGDPGAEIVTLIRRIHEIREAASDR